MGIPNPGFETEDPNRVGMPDQWTFSTALADTAAREDTPAFDRPEAFGGQVQEDLRGKPAENFEAKWGLPSSALTGNQNSKFVFTASDLVVFSILGLGREDFETGWSNDVGALLALTQVLTETGLFNTVTDPADAFETLWSSNENAFYRHEGALLFPAEPVAGGGYALTASVSDRLRIKISVEAIDTTLTLTSFKPADISSQIGVNVAKVSTANFTLPDGRGFIRLSLSAAAAAGAVMTIEKSAANDAGELMLARPDFVFFSRTRRPGDVLVSGVLDTMESGWTSNENALFQFFSQHLDTAAGLSHAVLSIGTGDALTGTNVTYEAVAGGANGNLVTVIHQFTVSASDPTSASRAGWVITVRLRRDAATNVLATNAEVAAAVNATPDVAGTVKATALGSTTALAIQQGATALVGGGDKEDFERAWYLELTTL